MNNPDQPTKSLPQRITPRPEDHLIPANELDTLIKAGVEISERPAAQIYLLRDGADGIEIFLGKRTRGGYLNQWCVQGGGFDKERDGDIEDAAARELFEETKLTISKAMLTFLGSYISETIRDKVDNTGKPFQRIDRNKISAFVVDANNLEPENGDPEEHDTMKWIAISQAITNHEKAVNEAAFGTDIDKIPNAIPSVALANLHKLNEFKTVADVISSISKI